MSKHTPGPWEVSGGTSDFDIMVEVDGLGWHEVAMSVDTEANARLIAAAPDLLEVVRMVVRSRDDADAAGDHYAELPTHVTDAARAAIEKATR